MPNCPNCGKNIHNRKIQNRISLKPYQACPFCGRPFTVDLATKRRQGIAIGIALTSLALTIGLFGNPKTWVIPAVSSYIVLGIFIYWGNKRVEFVRYENRQNPRKRT
jgi:hypothetical protein